MCEENNNIEKNDKNYMLTTETIEKLYLRYRVSKVTFECVDKKTFTMLNIFAKDKRIIDGLLVIRDRDFNIRVITDKDKFKLPKDASFMFSFSFAFMGYKCGRYAW